MEDYFPDEAIVPHDGPDMDLAARWRKHFLDNNPSTTGSKILDDAVMRVVNKIYQWIRSYENGYPLELPPKLAPGPERDELEARERELFDNKQDLPWKEYLQKNARWPMWIYLGMAHVFALVGLLITLTGGAKIQTILFLVALWPITAIGITAGAHRLWSHRSYKAGFPVRIMLMLFNSMANQGTIWHWSRDHRVHHKCSETPADPHNALRGFFFAHMGWLLVEKDPRVKQFGDTINLDDLVDMWEVRFQKHMGNGWMFLWCFIIPPLIATRYWGENFMVGMFVVGFLRYIIGLHVTWCVNSAAHLYGERPYESINPAENPWVSLGAIGEGWHNWHHAFPFDYAASELGISKQFNPTKLFIDTCARLGLVHSRKRATDHWKRRMDKLAQGEKIHAKLIGLEDFKRRVVTYGPDHDERIYGDQTPVKFQDVANQKKEKLLQEGKKAKEAPRDRTPAEVALHNTDDDCWIVIHNRVYDVTDFMGDHPGGEEAIAVFGGKIGKEQDATLSFDDTGHSDAAHGMLRDLFVGKLVSGSKRRGSTSSRKGSVSSRRASRRGSTSSRSSRKSTSHKTSPSSASSVSAGDVVLRGSNRRVGFELIDKMAVNHDTIKLVFRPTSSSAAGVPLGLPVGNHVRIGATVDGKVVERSYTPIPAEENDDPSSMTLCIKVYRPNEDFPKGGKMSQHMEDLSVGSRLAVKGPLGSITYHGRGDMSLRGRGDFSVSHAGFICGGSGITPAFAIIHAALMDSRDKTVMYLLYANKTPEDILLRDEIEALANQFPKRFKVHFTVNDASSEPNWSYSTGFVDLKMIQDLLPSGKNGDAFVGVCGPPPMIKYACNPNLEAHGYVRGQTFASF